MERGTWIALGVIVAAVVVWFLVMRKRHPKGVEGPIPPHPHPDPYEGGSGLGGPTLAAPSMNALAPWDPTWTAIPAANKDLLRWGIQTAGRDDLIPLGIVYPEYQVSRQTCQ